MRMAYFAPILFLLHLFFWWKERGKQEALIWMKNSLLNRTLQYVLLALWVTIHNILFVVAGGLPDSLSLSLGLEVGEALPVEAGMIGVVGIAFLQVLVILCCMWSVHISAFLTCTRVDNVKVRYHPILLDCRSSLILVQFGLCQSLYSSTFNFT